MVIFWKHLEGFIFKLQLDVANEFFWGLAPNGAFTMSSMYKLLDFSGINDDFYKNLQKVKVPEVKF